MKDVKGKIENMLSSISRLERTENQNVQKLILKIQSLLLYLPPQLKSSDTNIKINNKEES